MYKVIEIITILYHILDIKILINKFRITYIFSKLMLNNRTISLFITKSIQPIFTSVNRFSRTRSAVFSAKGVRLFRVPGGAWIIGRSLRVRHGPAFAYDAREEQEEEGRTASRERGSRQGSSPDPLATEARREGLLRPAWSMNGTGRRRRSTMAIGRGRHHSGARIGQSVPVGLSSLAPSLSFSPSLSFCSPARLPISIPHRCSSSSSSASSFSPVRLAFLVAERCFDPRRLCSTLAECRPIVNYAPAIVAGLLRANWAICCRRHFFPIKCAID